MMMKLSLVTVVLAQDPFAALQASSKLTNAVKSAEDKDAAVRGIAQPEVQPEIEPEVIIEPEEEADQAETVEIVSERVGRSSDGFTSCGSHTAASCEDCLAQAEEDNVINKSGYCNGDCVYDHKSKTCQASEERVDCGHHQAASCKQCTNDDEGERFCHDDCEWADETCSPVAQKLKISSN